MLSGGLSEGISLLASLDLVQHLLSQEGKWCKLDSRLRLP